MQDDNFYKQKLRQAIKSGRVDTIKRLFQLGFKLSDAKDALLLSAKSGHLDVIQVLLQQFNKEATLNEPSTGQKQKNITDIYENLFLVSAKFGHLDCIKYLLEIGISASTIQIGIKWASGNFQKEVVEYLKVINSLLE